jgi:hypothetical protein
MTQPSKLMCNLSSLSRGLDVENPEHNRKSRTKLSLKLRRVIAQVQQLEELENNEFIDLHIIKDMALNLIEDIKNNVPHEQLAVHAVAILLAAEGEE